MLLFNVTVIVDENSAADFLSWMKQNHIPQLMETDCFVSHRFLQIKDSPNEGLSFCVQFIAENEASHQRFLDLHEQAFIAAMYNRYPQKLVTFSTLMEFVG